MPDHRWAGGSWPAVSPPPGMLTTVQGRRSSSSSSSRAAPPSQLHPARRSRHPLAARLPSLARCRGGRTPPPLMLEVGPRPARCLRCRGTGQSRREGGVQHLRLMITVTTGDWRPAQHPPRDMPTVKQGSCSRVPLRAQPAPPTRKPPQLAAGSQDPAWGGSGPTPRPSTRLLPLGLRRLQRGTGRHRQHIVLSATRRLSTPSTRARRRRCTLPCAKGRPGQRRPQLPAPQSPTRETSAWITNGPRQGSVSQAGGWGLTEL